RSVGAFRGDQGEWNACNLCRGGGERGYRPPRRLAGLGCAGPGRCPGNSCQPQPGSRSGALARLSLPALVVAAPLASSLVVSPPEGGSSPGPLSSSTPAARRASRCSAPIKLARASARLTRRGSSTRRARKTPASSKPPEMPGSEGPPAPDSRRKAVKTNTLSSPAPPACRDTARPDFGDT